MAGGRADGGCGVLRGAPFSRGVAAWQVLVDSGYPEDFTVSNLKIVLGAVACVFALVAQFYPLKHPKNVPLLVVCVAAYTLLSSVLQVHAWVKEKDYVLLTYAKEGSAKGLYGLRLASTMERFSDVYKAKLCSTAAPGPGVPAEVTLEKSVTAWFHEDGYLAEAELKKDVLDMLARYEAQESRKTR